MARTYRAGVTFMVDENDDGAPMLTMERVSGSLGAFDQARFSLELAPGTTDEQAQSLADLLNQAVAGFTVSDDV